MTDTSNPPAAPPPSYDEVQAMSGGAPGYPGQPGAYIGQPGTYTGQPGAYQGQPGAYPPYQPQEGFKYDGVPAYPAQPAYPGYPAQSGQGPYPTQPGAPYPYGAPAPGVYPPPPPGTAAYNPQGGVTVMNLNPGTERMYAIQRRRKLIVLGFVLVFVVLFIYFVTNWLF